MGFASGFSWFHLIPSLSDASLLSAFGVGGHSVLLATAWFVCGVILVGAVFARLGLNRALSRPGLEKYFADDRLTFRTLAEVYVSAWMGLLTDIMGGKEARRYFMLIGAIFVYLLVNNLLGIIPGFLPATDNINTSVSIALIVFSTFMITGLFRDAKGFLAHMAGNMISGFLIPFGLLIFVIECIGFALRPMTLSLRITANMSADHTVLNVMSDLVPVWVPVPAIFVGFGIFVSVLQAFVFSLLTSLYIGMALPHHDESHDHH